MFKTAYNCGIRRFSWESLPVNHLFSAEEILIVPLDKITDQQARCINRISIPPNIMSSISANGDLAGAVQRLSGSDPVADWN
jgi:hypothetical protein